MKTFSHLRLDLRGLAALNAPEYKTTKEDNLYEKYQEELQQALIGRVYFKDDWRYHSILRIAESWEKYKIYPVPEGYEVKVEIDYVSEPHWFEYAILVPKEKLKSK